jgi:hypothetical protein
MAWFNEHLERFITGSFITGSAAEGQRHPSRPHAK